MKTGGTGTESASADSLSAEGMRDPAAISDRALPAAPDFGHPRFPELGRGVDFAARGEAMHAWITEVFPLCRSITGEGLRATFRSLNALLPLEIQEVPTGAAVFDWRVPKEWNIREAWIKAPDGRKLADFRNNNLHVVGYSAPVRARMSLADLKPHLHSLPGHPEWIPYRTSYYDESWGFCLPDAELQALPEGEYEVLIDSSLRDGSLTYAEHVVPGDSQDQILIWCHSCHPSLANDNLSGMAAGAFLARYLGEISAAGARLRHTYRFVFAPATIGAIVWLSRNRSDTHLIRHGLVLSLLGDSGPFTYKRSRRGDAGIDLAVARSLGESGAAHSVEDFSPFGYDERQFCSPGFDLPVGCLMRTPHGRFPEYHTSADNPDFVKPASLGESLRRLIAVVGDLECNGTFLNANPFCEPQLGRRGLYKAVGNRPDPGAEAMAMLWVLNLSDGSRSLSDIADRAGIRFPAVVRAAATLLFHGLLTESGGGPEKGPS